MSPASETNERVAVLETTFTDLKDDLKDIKVSQATILEHVRITNGRVTTIEAERAVEKALIAKRAHVRARVLGVSTAWLSPIVAALLGAAAVHFFS